ncbi:L-tryptophan decarboxylase [Psilocybe cubensis]|uniref:L-tryptophan decarboxylase n=1 Tax=Psilocybe cubensis TaxID=181762 RepID=A0ACB8GMJ1_PSICU|nr:L-tryptophan decarboxylase [Psilocybe cubensis]KAH9476873.1 L-tryptophan decarboxylase [Psilocybe cubensis]
MQVIPACNSAAIRSLCPTPESLRNMGWLSVSDAVYSEFIGELATRASNRNYSNEFGLMQPIQEFKAFIESDPVVHQEFIDMFEGIQDSPRNYQELCNMFNDIFRKAPVYGDLGPPVYMIMAKLMNTRAGFSAFTRQRLNLHFKKLFDTWGLFLSSKDSRNVLVADQFDDRHCGWLNERALSAMVKHYNGRAFDEVFLCDKNAPYYGFNSYDDFFNRRFRNRDIDRPVVGGVNNTTLISAACESLSYNVSYDVQSLDTLVFKGETYSLKHLLNNDPFTPQFEHGSILQGFLNVTAYHRWHAPVNGTIVKIINVPGTYFAQAPSTIGDPIPDNDYDPPPYLKSLVYFSNIAARQIMFIEADNKEIGLIFLVFIGMTEISTCEATVSEGQHVNRGDDLGMFHFGGSSFALGLRKDCRAEIVEKFTEPGTVIRINEVVAALKA